MNLASRNTPTSRSARISRATRASLEDGGRRARSGRIAAINSRVGRWSSRPSIGARCVSAPLILGAFALLSQRAVADEGGVSFWLPGTYGSLTAVPGVPGWSFSAFNYYDSVSASKGADFVRGGGIVAGVNSRIDFLFVNPAFVFATPVLGGQASLGVGALIGPNTTSAFGTLAGPGGASQSASRSDTVFGIGDLYPTGSLRWNWGVNNVMTYLTGDIPVGLYNAQQLANLGIGHGAVDAGGGYTYFDPQTGHEFSAVIGLTTTSLTQQRSTRTALTVIWIGARRNSCQQASSSARSAMSTTSSRVTADRARNS